MCQELHVHQWGCHSPEVKICMIIDLVRHKGFIKDTFSLQIQVQKIFIQWRPDHTPPHSSISLSQTLSAPTPIEIPRSKDGGIRGSDVERNATFSESTHQQPLITSLFHVVWIALIRMWANKHSIQISASLITAGPFWYTALVYICRIKKNYWFVWTETNTV